MKLSVLAVSVAEKFSIVEVVKTFPSPILEITVELSTVEIEGLWDRA